jgi:non-ribosomal peptide synthetase component E (peptide arylation enzyme)
MADPQMGGTGSAPLVTLPNPPTVAAYTAAGFWSDETIYHLAAGHAWTTLQACGARPPSPLSYAELVAAADRLAAHLAGHGIRPGHRVAVWLPHSAGRWTKAVR